MSNISLLEATAMRLPRQIWYMRLKLTLYALNVHTGCRKDRSSFRIACSRIQRTWKTSQEVDSENTFKLFSSRRYSKNAKCGCFRHNWSLCNVSSLVRINMIAIWKFYLMLERWKLLRIPFIKVSRRLQSLR